MSAASKQAPSVTTIIVPIHADRQVASVREAQLSHKHPERLSLFTPTTPFDATAYSAHPESYLDVIEPGRALAPAEAGPDVPLLKMLGTPRPTVASLGTVAITVQGMAQAPITFTSLDRGLFQNGLTSITLQADSHGLGTAEFTATAGTVAEVRVVAASPLASGQGHWVILIQAVTHG